MGRRIRRMGSAARRVQKNNDIDAVIVATWDNNHTMVASDACRALKDVYVEKPMTSRPEQGPPMVRTVRETGRIVQVGVQQRSTQHFWEAKEKFIDSGRLGPVHMVRTIWNNNIYYLLKPPPGMENKPAGLDCLGPSRRFLGIPRHSLTAILISILAADKPVVCSCTKSMSHSGILASPSLPLP